MLLFSTRSYAAMATRLIAGGGLSAGVVESKTFPDGERYQRIATPVEENDVVLVGGTISDGDTLELYDLAWSLVQQGARSLTLVIPYFGYSTMERAVRPGEVVVAKSRARMLSSLPTAPRGTRLMLVDVHTPGLPHYFEGDVRPYHIYAKPMVMEAARRLGGDDFVLACTDAGRAKWVESLANDLGVPASFVFKRRLDERQTEVAAVSAHVEGKRVVIYDDMIRTGGSLITAARAYRDAGALSIAAVATHGVLPAGSLDGLRDSNLFTRIVCTDSHPRALELQGDFLEVVSLAPVLATHLRQPPIS